MAITVGGPVYEVDSRPRPEGYSQILGGNDTLVFAITAIG